MAADVSWARSNKLIWRVSADRMGQPIDRNGQCTPNFLSRFFIFHLDPQRNPPQIVAESISIGQHCHKKYDMKTGDIKIELLGLEIRPGWLSGFAGRQPVEKAGADVRRLTLQNPQPAICRRRGDESFGPALLASCPTAKSGHSRLALTIHSDSIAGMEPFIIALTTSYLNRRLPKDFRSEY